MYISNAKFKFIFLSIIILILSLVFSFSNKANSAPKNLSEKKNVIYLNKLYNLSGIKIIAHRATYYNEPENSLSGIRSCINYKVDYAEIDVQETKDGTVILMHDYNLKRLTGLNKKVSDLDYNQIKKLNIHSHGFQSLGYEKIPTLNQVVTSSKGKLNLIIEIKPYGNTNDLTKKVVAIMEKNDIVKTSMVHSLSYGILLNVKRLDPNITTGYIVTNPIKNLSLMNVNFFSIKQNILNPNLIKTIHQSHKRVFVWTVDNSSNIKYAINLNVDGVITDKPETLKNLLNEKYKKINKI